MTIADPTPRPSYGRNMIAWLHTVFRPERTLVATGRAGEPSVIEFSFGDGMAGPSESVESEAAATAVVRDRDRSGHRHRLPIQDIDQLYAVAQAAGSTIMTNGDDDGEAERPIARRDPEGSIRVRAVDDRS